jgi:hypothetical protein
MADTKTEHATRRVGVEIEFSGIAIEQAVQVIAERLGGRIESVSPYEFEIHTSAHDGPFRLEVDFELLKKLGRDETETADVLRQPLMDLLAAAAAVATPLELVTPPIGFDEVAALDGHLNALAKVGAVGTQDSFAYAFGTHFNPELEDLSAPIILAHLRAFLCLYAWLKARDEIDLTRRLTSFADPFPDAYEALVLDEAYAPDRRTLIENYLEHNPTRNRALDMLPMFTHIDESLVRRLVDDERVKARPTFHYRLPNSKIGADDWSLMRPWRDWLRLERAAADSETLHGLMSARREHRENAGWLEQEAQWVSACQAILDQFE